MEEKLSDIERGKPRQSNGEWLLKTLKPAGCVFILLLGLLAVVMCFTVGSDPIKGYAPPHDGEYYAQHLDELAEEIAVNVCPRLDAVSGCEVYVSGDRVRVEIARENFAVTRSAILQYFDRELLEIVEKGKTD